MPDNSNRPVSKRPNSKVKSKGGRPPLLNESLMKEIVDSIRVGNYIEIAAYKAGIDRVTLHKWLKRGRCDKDGIYRELVINIDKAMAESEIRDVSLIAIAAKEDWKASAWRLERRFHERWGRKDRMEVSGPNGGPITIDLRGRLETVADLAARDDAFYDALQVVAEKLAAEMAERAKNGRNGNGTTAQPGSDGEAGTDANATAGDV